MRIAAALALPLLIHAAGAAGAGDWVDAGRCAIMDWRAAGATDRGAAGILAGEIPAAAPEGRVLAGAARSVSGATVRPGEEVCDPPARDASDPVWRLRDGALTIAF